MKKKAIYRDRQTGRFVKKATWKQSKARGGKRFVRTLAAPKRTKLAPEEEEISIPPPRNLDEWEEYIDDFEDTELEEIELEGAFDSP